MLAVADTTASPQTRQRREDKVGAVPRVKKGVVGLAADSATQLVDEADPVARQRPDLRRMQGAGVRFDLDHIIIYAPGSPGSTTTSRRGAARRRTHPRVALQREQQRHKVARDDHAHAVRLREAHRWVGGGGLFPVEYLSLPWPECVAAATASFHIPS